MSGEGPLLAHGRPPRCVLTRQKGEGSYLGSLMALILLMKAPLPTLFPWRLGVNIRIWGEQTSSLSTLTWSFAAVGLGKGHTWSGT